MNTGYRPNFNTDKRRAERRAMHRHLTRAGIPRHKGGNRLGLRRRLIIADAMSRREGAAR